MSIAKDIILEELSEQGHSERVEDVIFWALEHYAKSEPKGTWGRNIAYAIKERILELEKCALPNESHKKNCIAFGSGLKCSESNQILFGTNDYCVNISAEGEIRLNDTFVGTYKEFSDNLRDDIFRKLSIKKEE
jgi:hypothetical protein